MNTLLNSCLIVVRSVLAIGILLPSVVFGTEKGKSGNSFVLIRTTSGDERVQECRITPENNGFALELGENARYWLPQERVLCVGKSMVEIYEFRKQRVPVWSSGDHLQMGRWCLRHDLVDEASEHYVAIPAHHRTHRSVAQFGQALKSRMLADTDFRRYLGMEPIQTKTQTAASKKEELPDSTLVVTASAEASTLDISPEAKARFYSRVQPILKNRCSQAACHGFRGKSDFRLYEPYGQAFNRIAEANLLATAEHATREPGSETPALLKYATSAHGLQRSPGIKPNETTLINELAVWCNILASPVVSADGRSTTGGVETALASGNSLPLQPPNSLQPVTPGQTSLRSVPLESASQTHDPDSQTHDPDSQTQSGNANHTGFPKGTQPPAMSEIDKLEQELKQIMGETTPSSNSKPSSDPFDASTFNNLPR